MKKNINLSLLMDFYELTMASGLYKKDDLVCFEVFYRKNPDNGGFAIFAGLEQIVEYLLNLHFDDSDIEYLRSLKLFNEDFLNYLKNYSFKADVYSLQEGCIMYPNEPIMSVIANPVDAQLIETAILNQINHQSLIATKARRMVKAANGRAVVDFGARRAHNFDSAYYGARAAYIGGVSASATTLSAKDFNIPISGTMAHSWVMFFENEYEAFLEFAKNNPDNAVFLIDTYDVLNQGIKNAIKVAKDYLMPMGKRLKAVRLDSGDLAYLSKKVRKILDENGLNDCKIIVSNSLDEYTITSLLEQGACIDVFGVGERLITAKSDPVFGAVYKIVEINKKPRIKISESVEKITNPARKQLYRIYDEFACARADLITLYDEELDLNKPYIDSKKPWKQDKFINCTAKKLHHQIIKDGKLVYKLPSLEEIRQFVKHQLDNEIWQEEQRFSNPHEHYLDMSKNYYDLKMSLLQAKD